MDYNNTNLREALLSSGGGSSQERKHTAMQRRRSSTHSFDERDSHSSHEEGDDIAAAKLSGSRKWRPSNNEALAQSDSEAVPPLRPALSAGDAFSSKNSQGIKKLRTFGKNPYSVNSGGGESSVMF